jgi:hypothetical protein
MLGGFGKRDRKVVDISELVPGLLLVAQLICPANSALHSHRAPSAANLFGETGRWLASSSWSNQKLASGDGNTDAPARHRAAPRQGPQGHPWVFSQNERARSGIKQVWGNWLALSPMSFTCDG